MVREVYQMSSNRLSMVFQPDEENASHLAYAVIVVEEAEDIQHSLHSLTLEVGHFCVVTEDTH